MAGLGADFQARQDGFGRAASSPTVLGVVGLVESRTSTQDAIKELHDLALPIIAPTLSADDIGRLSRYYLQIAAPNQDQTDMVARYVSKVLGKKKIYNFYTYGSNGGQDAETDLYVNTLKDGLRSATTAEGVEYKELCGDQNGHLQSVRCGRGVPTGQVSVWVPIVVAVLGIIGISAAS